MRILFVTSNDAPVSGPHWQKDKVHISSTELDFQQVMPLLKLSPGATSLSYLQNNEGHGFVSFYNFVSHLMGEQVYKYRGFGRL